MAAKLTRADLLSLEAYHEQRSTLRQQVMAHKANRRVSIKTHAVLYFEDRLTIQYQIQEMLRVERIFQGEAIEEELAAYNPLIPDGANLKATFMIEYADIEERRVALERLLGIEDQVWIKVGAADPVYAIADEDMDRSNDTKTSAVHFLRFEFSPEMVAGFVGGDVIGVGISHPNFTEAVSPLPDEVAQALARDFA